VALNKEVDMPLKEGSGVVQQYRQKLFQIRIHKIGEMNFEESFS